MFVTSTPIRIAALCGIVLGCTVQAYAASGVQVTRDGRRTLINKDVGSERWAITFNLDDQTATGNVFRGEGEPSFVWCSATSNDGTTVTLSCYGSDRCPAAPCTPEQWSFIANVELPAQFFLPPGSPPLASCPLKLVTNGPNRENADSAWSCHDIGGTDTFDLQIFENGTGSHSTIAGRTFTFEGTACGTATFDFGIVGTWTVTNVKGTVETGVLTFHQQGTEGLGNRNIVCGLEL